MGAGASTQSNKVSFMRAAESGGFFKMIKDAKSDTEKLAAFEKIKAEVMKYDSCLFYVLYKVFE